VKSLSHDLLQEGIYFREGETPRRFFSIVFLNLACQIPDDGKQRKALAGAVKNQVAELWSRYQELKQGRVHDLDQLTATLDDDEKTSLAALTAVKGTDFDYATVPDGRLEVLLAFGVPLFTLLRGTADKAPQQLRGWQFNAPAGRGTPIYPESGIRYEGGSVDLCDAAVAVQFTADTLLAAERAIVETWKYLQDNPGGLVVQAAYTGSRRDDGRSWIDFYDGTSNLPPEERPDVIVIPRRGWRRAKALPEGTDQFLPSGTDLWTVGGTYLAFMRLYIDLSVWRSHDVAQQEALVGRRKLTGFPLLTATEPFPGARPWRYGDSHYVRPQHEADRQRLAVAARLDETIAQSHIQRVNHHNPEDGGSLNPMNHRIYRQGYSFFEPRNGRPPFRVGLNFVSFQWTPASLLMMLSGGGWMAGTNFGGPDGARKRALISARSAGIFLAPPWGEDDHFPGEVALRPQ
jgi:deferrochelatase/peroxidase EfeB